MRVVNMVSACGSAEGIMKDTLQQIIDSKNKNKKKKGFNHAKAEVEFKNSTHMCRNLLFLGSTVIY